MVKKKKRRWILISVVLFLLIGCVFHILLPEIDIIYVPLFVKILEWFFISIICGVIGWLFFFFMGEAKFVVKVIFLSVIFLFIIFLVKFSIVGWVEKLSIFVCNKEKRTEVFFIKKKYPRRIHGDEFKFLIQNDLRTISIFVNEEAYDDFEINDKISCEYYFNSIGVFFSSYYPQIDDVKGSDPMVLAYFQTKTLK